jgi:hypothetical protein
MGCRKTETFVIHGNVKHKYTNANISGIYVTIGSPGEPSVSNGTIYSSTYTDADGNYTFNFDLKVKNDFSRDFVIIAAAHDGSYDSTINNFKYFYESIKINESEFGNSQDFLLYPSGQITFFASDSTWNAINTDSILIKCPYDSTYLIRDVSYQNQSGLDVDPSTISTFSWCNIKNGVQSTLITKDIFVTNWWTYYNYISSSPCTYEIRF